MPRYQTHFHQYDPPGRMPGAAWIAELHPSSEAESPHFPLSVAYISDYRSAGGCGLVVLNFIWTPDHLRRQGHARRLIESCAARWPDLLLTDPISPEGEALAESLETHA